MKKLYFTLVAGGILLQVAVAKTQNTNGGGTPDKSEQGVSLTIYNDNFALVRETIPVDLKHGINEQAYDGATMTLSPDSVVLRLSGEDGVAHIAEQSYRNDTVSTSYMLSLFEGETIDFVRDAMDGTQEVVSGKIIRSGYSGGDVSEPMVEVDGKIRFGLPGTPLFPSMKDDTLLKPRLEWKIFSNKDFSGSADLSYLTDGMRWSASYNLVLPEKGDLADLSGLITIGNQTGRDFFGAQLQLLAGVVNRARDAMQKTARSPQYAMMEAGGMDMEVQQKSFDEFHLYTLPGRVNLRNKETKQVEFISASDVKAETIYRYVGQEIYYGYFSETPDATLNSPTSVTVARRISNTEDNQLGIPLPAGIFRIYRKDGDAMQFVGEAQIRHTPKKENVEIVTGQAFDVTAKRTRTDMALGDRSLFGKRTMTESFRFDLVNRKDEKITLTVVEYARGPDWVIVSESQPHRKTSATEIQWDIPIEADSEVSLEYTIKYTW